MLNIAPSVPSLNHIKIFCSISLWPTYRIKRSQSTVIAIIIKNILRNISNWFLCNCVINFLTGITPYGQFFNTPQTFPKYIVSPFIYSWHGIAGGNRPQSVSPCGRVWLATNNQISSTLIHGGLVKIPTGLTLYSSGDERENSGRTRSIPWLLMPWLLCRQVISNHGIDYIG